MAKHIGIVDVCTEGAARSLSTGMEIHCSDRPAGQRVPWHLHDAATLCVVVNGSVEEQDTRRVHDRRRGDLVFRPEPVRHRILVTGPRTQIVSLEIGASAMEALEDFGFPRRDPISLVSPRATRLARLAQAQVPDDDPAAELELMGLAYELIATVFRESDGTGSRPPGWVVRIHDYLREEFRTTPKLEDLAQREGVSPFRLSRDFRQYYGMSIGEFLRSVRVDHSMHLLADCDIPLTEVALDSGFYDQSHLTNVFKKYTGLTPGAFRRRV